MNKKKNNKGFSLIELIIAIAILIILTGMLAPQFMKYIEKSRVAKDMQTLDTVYTAVQGAIADEEAYKDLSKKMASGASLADLAKKEGLALTTLMPESPTDPFSKELYALLGKDAAAINNSFQSGIAKEIPTGNVWVSIDQNMQVVVTFGSNANTPATKGNDQLSVGSNAVINATTPSSATTP